jgi:hypothetical protein
VKHGLKLYPPPPKKNKNIKQNKQTKKNKKTFDVSKSRKFLDKLSKLLVAIKICTMEFITPKCYSLSIKQDITEIAGFFPKGYLLPISLFYIEERMIPINSFLRKLLLSVEYKRQVMAEIRIC